MKKVIVGMSVLLVLFVTASASANESSAFRVGGGYSKTSLEIVGHIGDTDYTAYDGDFGDGFKIEAGYDFNQAVGAVISYETNKGMVEGWDEDGHSIKVAVDIGYAFPINKAFVKPYLKVGFVDYSLSSYQGSDCVRYDDSALFSGLGIRFKYRHFYTDLSLDSYTLDEFSETWSADYNFTQTVFTVGYQF